MNQPLLSIILPAYHEESIIKETMQKTLMFLKQSGMLSQTEMIIVAVKGDKTAEIARSFAADFVKLKIIEPAVKVGKGRDVRLGFEAASGQYRLFMDADLSTPLNHVIEALNLLKSGADVVIGRRNLKQIHTGLRAYISQVGAFITRVVLLPKIHDSQCGFKAFNELSAEQIFRRQKINGWAFDMEVLAIASRHKLKISELPILDWRETRAVGLQGETSTTRATLKTFRELLKIRLSAWRGLYK